MSSDANIHMEVTITNCVFEDNRSSQSGGALLVNGNTSAVLNQTQFTGNWAFSHGGAIYCSSENKGALIMYDRVTLLNNGDNRNDDDQIYNDPSSACQFTCTNQQDLICLTYQGTLPDLELTLVALGGMVGLELLALIAFHFYCWRVTQESVSRFGYINLY